MDAVLFHLSSISGALSTLSINIAQKEQDISEIGLQTLWKERQE
jgi:hypothetical protein